jgi:hypothetical protein
LSDDEKRAEYDESGELYGDDDDLFFSRWDVYQWTYYFHKMFPTATFADIDAFELKYKCSDVERANVLKCYNQFKGDLNKMLRCVILSSDADKERWVKDYINPAIKRGEVKDFSDKVKKTLRIAPTKKLGLGLYKFSDDEEADVLKYYSQLKGDLNKMLECVMESSNADKERWVKDYINPAIKRREVKDFSDKVKSTLEGASVPAKTIKLYGRRSWGVLQLKRRRQKVRFQ